jgi:geranylgeranyl pyrophosphate synthase
MNSFFEESMDVKEAIRKNIDVVISKVSHPKLKDIIRQRNKTSNFLKGTIGYFIHEGVGGTFSEKKKLELAAGIEVLCSSGAIFDNAIDGHEEKNGETTLLKEYGVWMQVAASQYVLHYGLKMVLPFMGAYIQKFSHMYSVYDAVVGMVGMDIETSSNLDEQIKTIEKSNGGFAEVPLVIVATTGTDNPAKIENISKYGFNLGTALGIYEEVRDILGKHGRRRTTEIEGGRFAIALHYANEMQEFNAKQYVGETINDRTYDSMIQGLIQSKALRRTQSLAASYFQKAEDTLRLAVNQPCFEKLSGLPKSVSLEFEEIVREAEENYG